MGQTWDDLVHVRIYYVKYRLIVVVDLASQVDLLLSGLVVVLPVHVVVAAVMNGMVDCQSSVGGNRGS